jgi:hypothetical protein
VPPWGNNTSEIEHTDTLRRKKDFVRVMLWTRVVSGVSTWPSKQRVSHIKALTRAGGSCRAASLTTLLLFDHLHLGQLHLHPTTAAPTPLLCVRYKDVCVCFCPSPSFLAPFLQTCRRQQRCTSLGPPIHQDATPSCLPCPLDNSPIQLHQR